MARTKRTTRKASTTFATLRPASTAVTKPNPRLRERVVELVRCDGTIEEFTFYLPKYRGLVNKTKQLRVMTTVRTRGQMIRAGPHQPQLHYANLTVAQKQSVRLFEFLELPPELRNKIYDVLLDKANDPMYFVNGAWCPSELNDVQSNAPQFPIGLSMTNSQIRFELMGLVYKKIDVHFRLSTVDPLHSCNNFIARLGEDDYLPFQSLPVQKLQVLNLTFILPHSQDTLVLRDLGWLFLRELISLRKLVVRFTADDGPIVWSAERYNDLGVVQWVQGPFLLRAMTDVLLNLREGVEVVLKDMDEDSKWPNDVVSVEALEAT